MIKYSHRSTPSPIKTCPFCGKTNPRRAYCCLHCYKILNQETQVSLLRIEIKPSVSILVILGILFFGGMLYIRQWMQQIELHVDMELQNAQYNRGTALTKVRKLSAEKDSPPRRNAADTFDPSEQLSN